MFGQFSRGNRTYGGVLPGTAKASGPGPNEETLKDKSARALLCTAVQGAYNNKARLRGLFY
jgi:hypothetical protein